MNLKIPGIDKLIELTASGVGSVAGTFLAPWKARKEGQVKVIAAKADAEVLSIQAKAHIEAREIMVGERTTASREISISNRINERILYQEEKRLGNIECVVATAAEELRGKDVPDDEPDHDWTARFFNYVQDVSSKDMQALWAKVLAGEAERTGSTSLRTLGILRDLDRATANLFAKACSACVLLGPQFGIKALDARVPSLGGNAASNALQEFGLGFGALNRLNERGLVISDYNSWFDYNLSILPVDAENKRPTLPFEHQNKSWFLVPDSARQPQKQFQLHGVALTNCGCELASVVDRIPMDNYTERLKQFFVKNKLNMVPISQETT